MVIRVMLLVRVMVMRRVVMLVGEGLLLLLLEVGVCLVFVV